MIRLLSSILILISLVHSFPGGAPLEQCGSMMPGHGKALPIQTKSPFNILIAPNQGGSLNVTIMSDCDKHFKGFLIEARRDLDREEAIGTWETEVEKTKTLDCFDQTKSAVTHNLKHGHHHDHGNIYKHDHHHHHGKKGHHFVKPSFTWIPPKDLNDETVYFIATVVKKYSQIYTNVTAAYQPADQ